MRALLKEEKQRDELLLVREINTPLRISDLLLILGIID
jgi:hypothetical protein